MLSGGGLDIMNNIRRGGADIGVANVLNMHVVNKRRIYRADKDTFLPLYVV